MPISGKLMERLGPRNTAILGGVLVGLGWALGGLLTSSQLSLLMMVLTYGVIGGSGVGMVYGVPIAVSSRWIPERKGLAVGLTVMGFGLSPLITAPLAKSMIDATGVLNTFTYLGLAFLAALVLLSLPLRFPEGPGSSAQAKAGEGISLTPREIVKTATFYGIWLAYVLGTMGGFIAISLAAKYGEEVVALDSATAALATSLFAVFNGIGRPTFGFICDRIGVKKGAVISFLLILIASLTATQSTTLVPYLASFAILWFTFGGWLAITPIATSSFFGLKHQSVNYGIVFTAFGASALIGPSLAGYIYQSTGTYYSAFLVTAAISVFGMIIAALTFRKPKPASSAGAPSP
jgi:MFS family permease